MSAAFMIFEAYWKDFKRKIVAKQQADRIITKMAKAHRKTVGIDVQYSIQIKLAEDDCIDFISCFYEYE